MQRIFDRGLATDSGAVGIFLVAGSDTLDHNHGFRITDLITFHLGRQFQLGHYPIAPAV